MSKVISIVNQKGGVGKTTTSINLSSALSIKGQKVLLIDVDPQANSTTGLGIESNKHKNSIYEVLIGKLDINDTILHIKTDDVYLVPSSINLVGAEIELVSQPQREQLLKNALSKIRNNFDYIVIDCPPSLGLLTINALTAANSVLIPVQCEYYALEGLSKLLNTIYYVRKGLNKELQIEGILLTMFDSRLKLSHQVETEVRNLFGKKAFRTIINRNVRLSEAPSHGKSIFQYDPTSIGAKNYTELAEEILKINN
ncbi:MAG: ParA family protein [Candidatus Kapaibacteriales bacterium]